MLVTQCVRSLAMSFVLSLVNVLDYLDVVDDVKVFCIESLATDVSDANEYVVTLGRMSYLLMRATSLTPRMSSG